MKITVGHRIIVDFPTYLIEVWEGNVPPGPLTSAPGKVLKWSVREVLISEPGVSQATIEEAQRCLAIMFECLRLAAWLEANYRSVHHSTEPEYNEVEVP